MLKTINYENITVQQIIYLMESGYFTEIICDGDTLKVGISEEEYMEAEKRIRKSINDIMRPVTESIEQIANAIVEIFNMTMKVINNLYKAIYTIMDKKISKKKFIKLLQSEGIQRNEINRIVKGNKEKYTYLRYYNIINNLDKNNKIKNNRI